MVIAERTLEIFVEEHWRPLTIRIFLPTRGEDWTCAYEIGWPVEPRRFAAHGIDSAQALLLAFYAIGAELHASTWFSRKALRCDGSLVDFGFPVHDAFKPDIEGYTGL